MEGNEILKKKMGLETIQRLAEAFVGHRDIKEWGLERQL